MAKEMRELELERWMLDHPESIGASRWLTRQLRLPHGVIDLLGEDENGDWMVVELKVAHQSDNALLQVIAYAEQMQVIRDTMYPGGGPAIRKIVISEYIPVNTYLQAGVAMGVEVYRFRVVSDGAVEIKRYFGLRRPDGAAQKLFGRAIERIQEGYTK